MVMGVSRNIHNFGKRARVDHASRSARCLPRLLFRRRSRPWSLVLQRQSGRHGWGLLAGRVQGSARRNGGHVAEAVAGTGRHGSSAPHPMDVRPRRRDVRSPLVRRQENGRDHLQPRGRSRPRVHNDLRSNPARGGLSHVVFRVRNGNWRHMRLCPGCCDGGREAGRCGHGEA